MNLAGSGGSWRRSFGMADDETKADEKNFTPEQTELKEHLDAIVSDVIVADGATTCCKEISESSEDIDEHNLCELFGFL
jgi:hypothetical protein